VFAGIELDSAGAAFAIIEQEGGGQADFDGTEND
jgi:hypothetical protein